MSISLTITTLDTLETLAALARGEYFYYSYFPDVVEVIAELTNTEPVALNDEHVPVEQYDVIIAALQNLRQAANATSTPLPADVLERVANALYGMLADADLDINDRLLPLTATLYASKHGSQFTDVWLVEGISEGKISKVEQHLGQLPSDGQRFVIAAVENALHNTQSGYGAQYLEHYTTSPQDLNIALEEILGINPLVVLELAS